MAAQFRLHAATLRISLGDFLALLLSTYFEVYRDDSDDYLPDIYPDPFSRD